MAEWESEPEIERESEPEIGPEREPEIGPESELEIKRESEPEIKLECEPEIGPEKEENEFSYPWSCSDVVLLVEGSQLQASKAVLRMVSPVLQTMLNQASSDKTAEEVPLPHKKYADVVEFLRCVHPHVSKDVTEEWLEVLLSLAEEFQCQVLTQKCRTFLKNQMERCRLQRKAGEGIVFGETVLRWLRLTDQFLKDRSLVQGLVEELQKKMDCTELTETEDYQKLSGDTMRCLFSTYTIGPIAAEQTRFAVVENRLLQ